MAAKWGYDVERRRETEIMAGRSGWPWIGGSRDDVQERRAQIYRLNAHMKAIEEKRWQCCVAGRQRQVDAISKCVDVFSRCTPPRPAPTARAPHTRVADRNTTRSSVAPQGEPAVGPEALVGARDRAGARAEAASAERAGRDAAARWARPRRLAAAADDARGLGPLRRAAAVLPAGAGVQPQPTAPSVHSPAAPQHADVLHAHPYSAPPPPPTHSAPITLLLPWQTEEGCHSECCPLLHARLPRECVTWRLRW